MTDGGETPHEIFVAVRVGEIWRVMDTRNGRLVDSGPLTQHEAVDLAALLNSMAGMARGDKPDRPA